MFVTHDIGAAVEIADRVAVMYAGRIVEEASMSEILRHPRHPYTQVLLGSRPKEGLKKGDALHCIPGAPPDLARCRPAAPLPSAARTVARSVSRVCRRRNPSRSATR